MGGRGRREEEKKMMRSSGLTTDHYPLTTTH